MPEQTTAQTEVQPENKSKAMPALVLMGGFLLGIIVTILIFKFVTPKEVNIPNNNPAPTEMAADTTPIITESAVTPTEDDGWKTEEIEYSGEDYGDYAYQLTIPSDATEEEINMDGPLGHKIKNEDFELIIFSPYEGYNRRYSNLLSIGENTHTGYEIFKYNFDSGLYGMVKAYTTNVNTTGTCGEHGSPQTMPAPCGSGVVQDSKISNFDGVEIMCVSGDESICDRIAKEVKKIK